jgi:hypothetical protein
MSTSKAKTTTEWLIRIAIILAIPAIPCFGYYSLAYLGEERSAWMLPAVLSLPVLLIGLIALMKGVDRRSSKLRVWLAGLLIAVPAVFLLWLRN